MRLDLGLIAFLALVPAIAASQDGAADPLRTPPCLAARAELDMLLAQARPRPEQLEQARRRTAQACLGTGSAQRQRSGAAEPAQAVPRASANARPPVQPPAIAATAPPITVPRPTAITTCDPAGCWDSEGRRLNQMGPMLVGPGGVCNGLGAIVVCP